jgi:dolichol-phosphate mannosyltransferase
MTKRGGLFSICEGQQDDPMLKFTVGFDKVHRRQTLLRCGSPFSHHRHSAVVGIIAILADLATCYLSLSQGLGLREANISGFLVSTLIYFLFHAGWLFAKKQGEMFQVSTHHCAAFLLFSLMALFVRNGVLGSVIDLRGWPTHGGILVAVGVTGVFVYFAGAFGIYSQKDIGFQSMISRRAVALGVVAYLIALRLSYLGLPELMQEEAYYWNYAKHLDIGYLDHPPLVAWIIWFTTALLGDSEFSVRIGALACWLIAASFSFALTKDFFDKSTALNALLLLSVLPFFFGVGFVMTPDAPLVACWAGALYFLARALVMERRLAWWGAGVCLGLGMLSKYTIALLGPATLLFLLVNPRSRHLLLKPEPYLAILVAGVLFSPVIVWNAEHEWASFTFQGIRRLQEPFQFSTHKLIGYALFFLTPTGIITFIAIMVSKIAARDDDHPELKALTSYVYKFALVFFLLPLGVFFIFSLAKDVKMNWTGPAWLVTVPFMAWYFSNTNILHHIRGLAFLKRAWLGTIFITLLFYGASLHYLSFGIPGIPYPNNFSLLGWKGLGETIERIEDEIEYISGVEPLVVGMDKMQTASGLAFYRHRAEIAFAQNAENEGAFNTASRHLFGGDSLMYRFWFPAKKQEGRIMILVARHKEDLTNPNILSHVQEMEKIRDIEIRKNGIYAGRCYYTITKGYRSHKEPPG